VFISVNDTAVHGVPGRRRLRRGDLVSLDVTAELDGFFADACVSVLADLGGHGIGRTIHEPPSIPNAPDPDDTTRLHDGLVITVEPILGAGDPAVYQEDDGWTISTVDGSWAVHTEHTIVVGARRPLVLTG
jgi:methionyl aminopeptidase